MINIITDKKNIKHKYINDNESFSDVLCEYVRSQKLRKLLS